MAVVRSHHLVLRPGVDVHHARVAVGDSLAIRVFVEKGLHIFTHPVCCCCIVNLFRECAEEYALCNIKMLYYYYV